MSSRVNFYSHSPVPDLTIELTAPGRSYDHLGQRVYFGTDPTVDCAVDYTGIPTEVSQASNERWLGVFPRARSMLRTKPLSTISMTRARTSTRLPASPLKTRLTCSMPTMSKQPYWRFSIRSN